MRVSASRRNNVSYKDQSWAAAWRQKIARSQDAIASTRDVCAPRNQPNWTISHNSYLQLRELDLLGRLDGAASSSSHSSFCEEVFSRCSFCSGARRGERQ